MGQINRQLHWILSFGNLVISICGTPGLIENFENKITVSLSATVETPVKSQIYRIDNHFFGEIRVQ